MSQICENKENKEQEPMRTIYYNDAFEDDYEDHSSSICSIISDDYTFDNSDYDDTGFEEEMTSKKISIVDTIIETEKTGTFNVMVTGVRKDPQAMAYSEIEDIDAPIAIEDIPKKN